MPLSLSQNVRISMGESSTIPCFMVGLWQWFMVVPDALTVDGCDILHQLKTMVNVPSFLGDFSHPFGDL